MIRETRGPRYLQVYIFQLTLGNYRVLHISNIKKILQNTLYVIIVIRGVQRNSKVPYQMFQKEGGGARTFAACTPMIVITNEMHKYI